MMMMVVNCFCGIVDQWRVFSLVSSWGHCQRSSPSRISDTLWTVFEPTQNLSSGFVEWSCAVVITTTPRHHIPHTSPFTENQLWHEILVIWYYKFVLTKHWQNFLLPIFPITWCCVWKCIFSDSFEFNQKSSRKKLPTINHRY